MGVEQASSRVRLVSNNDFRSEMEGKIWKRRVEKTRNGKKKPSGRDGWTPIKIVNERRKTAANNRL